MNIFISGGCKNGKSFYAQHYAQHLAKKQKIGGLYYIATMKPVDEEDKERIVRHRSERNGLGFKTIEQYTDIEKILDKCEYNSSFLLDSLTALLANEMFPADGSVNEHAAEKISGGLLKVMDNTNNIVIVSDYIYGDGRLYDPLTEKYRKALAEIDYGAAKKSDIVLEIVFTNVIIHKGKELFGELYE